VPAGILPLDSFVLGNQLNTIAKERLETYRGALAGDVLQAVDGALSVSLGLKVGGPTHRWGH